MKDRIRITPKMAHLADDMLISQHRSSLRPVLEHRPFREQASGMFNLIERQTGIISHETLLLVEEAIAR